ncbi:150R [Cherax quadricarinatus iridovirus]|uniref:Mitochondrial DNA topoisomerase n=1 Tax=Shrimp hemocyte iridescent virus TaxID=2039780 RepID=A0A291B0I3_9VIRU|nr:150R [Cherax quadricarinatus iridovirus]YP_010084758.1 mitochondrial DNA topoisomerase [Shrimp hemocyte iridescent virus]UPA43296.1 mitochondrial DNA topoisomerase [Iridovirus CN01]ASZ85130.1 150R [Cherax quadricarinatus iridovirus]ATE87015.1 mitochondrial DNA topoisomerase [Shrimp hemocyte iridescent virus]UPA43531.1 mitochondrial DNA topoisomerase [Iridovirus CN01]UPA43728.1 mitochondrial DNA topoisomerase [Iridovirus CN01]
MAKFCFTANRTNAISYLKQFYEKINVDIEIDEENPRESCIILKNEGDREIFLDLNKKLSKMDGFSHPYLIPNWKFISHKGPFLPQYAKRKYFKSKLIGKDGREYILSPREERVAFLYPSISEKNKSDEIFMQNFWRDFKTYTKVPFENLNDVIWTNVIANYNTFSKRQYVPDVSRFSSVEIDGMKYPATPFAAEDFYIFTGKDESKRGRIRRSIEPRDVILNLSPGALKQIPHIDEFKQVVYKPGVKWAAKWNDPLTDKVTYMDIVFGNGQIVENYTDDDDYGLDLSSSDDESEEKDRDDETDDAASYRDSDTDSDSGPDTDVDEDDELEYQEEEQLRISEIERRRLERALEESIPIEEKLDFNSLDESELNLPLVFIETPKHQWFYVNEACISGFKVVKNLEKVSNKILRLIAESALMGLRKGNPPVPELNKHLIEYAYKRNVF